MDRREAVGRIAPLDGHSASQETYRIGASLFTPPCGERRVDTPRRRSVHTSDRAPDIAGLPAGGRRHASAVRVLAAAFLIVFLGAPLRAEPPTLSGVVLDADGRPAAQAEVVVAGRDAAAQARVLTDAAGRFRLPLPAGPWVVDARGRDGWRAAAQRIGLEEASAPLTLRLDRPSLAEQVVVTAERRPQTAEEVAKSITTIDAPDVAARAEFTIGEAIRPAAGVQIRVDGGPGQLTTLRIRGLRADAAAVLVDGARFRDVTTVQGDAQALLSALHVMDLDRIEVLRGSASSLYGTNAVGGAVNVISRTGAASPGGEVQVEGGGLGFGRARGTFGGSAADGRLHYSGGASQIVVTRGVDGHDEYRSTGGQGSATWVVRPSTSIAVRLLGSDDRLDLNTSPSAFEIPAGNLGSGARVEARPLPDDRLERLARGEAVDFGSATYVPGVDDPDDEREVGFYTGGLRLTHQRDRLSVEARYHRLHTRRRYYARPGGVGFQPLAESLTIFDGGTDTAEGIVSLDLPHGLFVAGGYEFERERFNDLQEERAPGGLRVRTRVSQRAHAWSARGGLRSVAGVDVTASLRAQTFDLTAPRFDAIGVENRYADVPLGAPPTAVTGDVAVAWLMHPSTKLRVHAGNAYRAPSLFERFGGGFSSDPSTGIVSFTPYGDPMLEPDRYWSIDGGVDQAWWGGRGRVRATIFHTRIRQVSEFDFSGAIDPATDPYGRFAGYINGAGGRARGLELETDVRTRAMTLRASYTLTDVENDRDVVVPGYFGPFGVARHTASVTAWRAWGPAELIVDLYARSGVGSAFFTSAGNRVLEFPAAAKLDVGGAWTWRTGRRTWRAYAKVDNVLDRRIYELGWITPGATATAGLRLTY